MRLKFGIMLVLAAVVVTGCGPEVKYVQMDPTVLSPKPKGYDMPVSYETPERAFRVLGEMYVSETIKPSFEETGTFDKVLAELKKRALKTGADAIMNLKTMDSQEEGGKHGKLTLVGTLIIYTAPPEMSDASN